MSKLKSVNFGFGTVGYISEEPAVPATTETKGNVTVNDMGSPGKAAFWEVSNMFSCTFEAGDETFSNIFHLTTRIPGSTGATPYIELEAEAARQYAPMLRAIADSIEKQVAEFDAKQKKPKD